MCAFARLVTSTYRLSCRSELPVDEREFSQVIFLAGIYPAANMRQKPWHCSCSMGLPMISRGANARPNIENVADVAVIRYSSSVVGNSGAYQLRDAVASQQA